MNKSIIELAEEFGAEYHPNAIEDVPIVFDRERNLTAFAEAYHQQKLVDMKIVVYLTTGKGDCEFLSEIPIGSI